MNGVANAGEAGTDVHFGRVLERLRTERGLSLAELARRVNALRDGEHGDGHRPIREESLAEGEAAACCDNWRPSWYGDVLRVLIEAAPVGREDQQRYFRATPIWPALERMREIMGPAVQSARAIALRDLVARADGLLNGIQRFRGGLDGADRINLNLADAESSVASAWRRLRDFEEGQ